jgi:hypothetical protein
MSIASSAFLAATLSAGLMVSGGALAGVQGFSIELSDLTPHHNASGGLSAEVAAFGGQPAKALRHNGSYVDTLTGDYAVVDDLPPSDEAVFWQTFTQITLNGNPFFTANAIVGPESPDQIWQAILNITNLKPAVLMLIVNVLEKNNYLSILNGEFDYGYNFAPDDRTVGTFAVGSTEGLLLGAFDSDPLPDGPNVWSLTFSATVTTIPEPPTWLMLMAGGAGLLIIRGLARRPGVERRVPA